MKVDGSEASRGVLMRKYATRGEYATPAQFGFRALQARLRACMASIERSAGADEWFDKCRSARFALRRLGVNGNYITEVWSRLALKLLSTLPRRVRGESTSTTELEPLSDHGAPPLY